MSRRFIPILCAVLCIGALLFPHPARAVVTIQNPIPDQVIKTDFVFYPVADLSEVFSSTPGEITGYTLSSSNAGIEVVRDGALLQVRATCGFVGRSTISVTPQAVGGSPTDSFVVSVSQKQVDRIADVEDLNGRAVHMWKNYAIAGAPGVDGKGAAYVYKRNESQGWIQIAKLTSTLSAPGDFFGISVAISEHYAVVGADHYNGKGAVFIFQKPAGEWADTNQASTILTVSGAYNGDYFGQSVALSVDHVVVGARGDDREASEAGAAHIYKKDESGWKRITTLTAGDAAKYDYFGSAVAIDGDWAAIGARGVGDDNSGAVYLYNRDEDLVTGVETWTFTQKLAAGTPIANEYFGNAVALSSDQLVVGNRSSALGSVYVFQLNLDTWFQAGILTSSNRTSGDRFGWGVAIADDFIIAGAQLANDEKGAAYVFEKSGASWSNMTETRRLKISSDSIQDKFGQAVGIVVDPDRVEVDYSYDAMVGAPGDDEMGENAGGVYFFGTVSLTLNAPVISFIQDQVVEKDGTIADPPLPFLVCNPGGGEPVLTWSSDNPTLLPEPGSIVFGGTAPNKTMTIAPAAGEAGEALITITAGTAPDQAETSFRLMVTDEPIITADETENVVLLGESASFDFTITDKDTDQADIDITTESTNEALVPNVSSSIIITSTGSANGVHDYTLQLVPVANVIGTTDVTLTIDDGTYQKQQTFTFTVTDAPTLTIPETIRTDEDTPITVDISIVDADTPANYFDEDVNGDLADIVVVSNTDTTLLPNTNIVFNRTTEGRTLSLTPARNLFGEAVVTVEVTDIFGFQDTAIFTVIVDATNDLPTVQKMSFDVTVAEETTITAEGGVLSGAGGKITVNAEDTILYNGVTYVIGISEDGAAWSGDLVVPAGDTVTVVDIRSHTITIDEDLQTGEVQLWVNDSDDELVTITIESSNSTLLPQNPLSIYLNGPGFTMDVAAPDYRDGYVSLILTPVENKSGTAVVTVNVTDTNDATSSKQFILNVVPEGGFNLLPQIKGVREVRNLIEVAGSDVNITGTGVLPITVNTGLATELTLAEGDTIRINRATPVTLNATASYPVDLTIGDQLTVYESDVKKIGAVAMDQNEQVGPIEIELDDPNEQNLSVLISTENNEVLMPDDPGSASWNNNIAVGAGGSAFGPSFSLPYSTYGSEFLYMYLAPARDESGSADMRITVTDSVGAVATHDFLVIVNSTGGVNFIPKVESIEVHNYVYNGETINGSIIGQILPMDENTSLSGIKIRVNDNNGDNLNVSVRIAQGDDVVPNDPFYLNIDNFGLERSVDAGFYTQTSPDGDLSLRIRPLNNKNGTVKVVVRVEDPATTFDEEFFFVSVNPTPAPKILFPESVDIENLIVNEDESLNLEFQVSSNKEASEIDAVEISTQIISANWTGLATNTLTGDELNVDSRIVTSPGEAYIVNLTIEPTANANFDIYGLLEIILRAEEILPPASPDTPKVTEQRLKVTVVSVADTPMITFNTAGLDTEPDGDLDINEDGMINLPVTIENVDRNPEGDAITIDLDSRNENLVPDNASNLNIGGEGAPYTFDLDPATHDGTFLLTVKPAANANSDLFGTGRIFVEAEDDNGTTAEPFTIEVAADANDPPKINNDLGIANQSVAEDGETSFQFTIADPDREPVDVTVSFTAGSADLIDATGLTLTGPGIIGTRVGETIELNNINLTGSGEMLLTLALEPKLNANSPNNGIRTIEIEVDDGTAPATETFELTVNPVSDVPVITGIINFQTFTTDQDDQLILSPTGGGGVVDLQISDPDWGDVDIVVGGADAQSRLLIPTENIQITGANVTPNVDPGSYTLGLVNGSPVTLGLTLTPAAKLTGRAKIDLTVTGEGDGSSRKVTFYVDVNNVPDPPEIDPIVTIPSPIMEETPFTLTFRVRDWESNTLSFAFAEVGGPKLKSAATFSGTGVFFDSNADLYKLNVAAGQWYDVNVTLQGDTDQIGLATARLSVTDGDGGTADIDVDVTIQDTNEQPSISSAYTPPITLNEDGVTTDFSSATVEATDDPTSFTVNDVDGDELRISVTSSNTNLLPLASIFIAGSFSGGVGIPANQLDAWSVTTPGPDVTLELGLEPVADKSGSATLTVTVDDQRGEANSTATLNFSVSVIPGNDPPTVTLSPTTKDIDEGDATSFDVTVTDIDGQNVTLSVTSNNAAMVPNNNISIAGSGNSVTVTTTPTGSVTRTVNLQTVINQSGTMTLTVAVNDNNGGTDSKTFTLNVAPNNEAPVLSGASPQQINGNDQNTITFQVTDPDTDPGDFTFTITSNKPSYIPDGNITRPPVLDNDRSIPAQGIYWYDLTLMPANGVVSSDASDTADIVIQVQDEGAGTDTHTVKVLIASPGTEPRILQYPTTLIQINEDESGFFTFLISDQDTDVGVLSVNVTTDTPLIIPNSNIDVNFVMTDLEGRHQFRADFSPAKNAFTAVGTPVTLTIFVSDGTFSDEADVEIAVIEQNDPPVIELSPVPVRTTIGTPITVDFQVSDPDIQAGGENLTFNQPTSTSPILLPNDTRLKLNGLAAGNKLALLPGETKTISITITPGAGLQGTAAFKLTVRDASGSATDTFSRNYTLIVGNIQPGDVDNDGDIDIDDAVLILRMIADTPDPSKPIQAEADLNFDGRIGIEDVLYILQVIAELR